MAAIGPENIIPKLCFAVYGELSPDTRQTLRRGLSRLAEALRKGGKASVTRQAVHKLFDGALPSREGTYQLIFQFAKSIAADKEFYDILPNERKIVLGQILTFCRRRQRTEAELEVYGVSSGHITIRQERIYSSRQYSAEADYYVGTYQIFKKRLSNNDDKPISQEIFEIYKGETHLYGRWWILLDGQKVVTYDGTVVLVGTSLLLLLYNASLAGRFRVLNVTKTGWGRTPIQFHSGVLLSTTPHHHNPTPTACRVFIEKINSIDEDKIRKKLRHLHASELNHANKDLILRLISNDETPHGRLDAFDDVIRSITPFLGVSKSMPSK